MTPIGNDSLQLLDHVFDLRILELGRLDSALDLLDLLVLLNGIHDLVQAILGDVDLLLSNRLGQTWPQAEHRKHVLSILCGAEVF